MSSNENTAGRIPRVALVTGAAHRIGRAIALDLAEHGFDIAVHYNRSGEAAEELAETIRAKGRKAAALAADLASEEDTETLVGRAAESFGPVGLLVNNASRFEFDMWDDATRESWDVHMETNLRAPFLLSQSMARGLPADLQGALVLADVASGEVLALVGGREVRYAGFNRALDARRPIGSLVKPAVFLAALETPR